MKFIKLSISIFAISVLAMACNTAQEQAVIEQTPANVAVADMTPLDENEYWAKDNFDLQRVGNLFERSDSPQQFESYINDPDYGVNNLDLNGDGYVDYISVREFDDRGDGERGLSLFSRFGPDLIQEIATILLYRDEPNYPGARVLVRGNDQIYGDSNYYEGNWVDRTIGIVSTLFSDRDDYYQSPYYYDNYPQGYNVYEVVDPQYYRTRVVELYPEPMFVSLAAPPAYYSKIKIKSPNNGLHLGQIKARLVKPTKDQEDFLKSNPARPKFAKMERGKPEKIGRSVKPGRADAPGRQNDPSSDKKGGNPNAGKPDDKGAGAGKNDDKGRGNPNNDKGQGQGKGQGKGKP
jgi:hypothetical protein